MCTSNLATSAQICVQRPISPRSVKHDPEFNITRLLADSTPGLQPYVCPGVANSVAEFSWLSLDGVKFSVSHDLSVDGPSYKECYLAECKLRRL